MWNILKSLPHVSVTCISASVTQDDPFTLISPMRTILILDRKTAWDFALHPKFRDVQSHKIIWSFHLVIKQLKEVQVSHHFHINHYNTDFVLLFYVLFPQPFNSRFKSSASTLFTTRPSSAMRSDKEHMFVSDILEFTQDIWAVCPPV